MNHQQFNVADLETGTVEKILSFEEKLRSETGREIVLIAYQNEQDEK